MSRRNAHRLGLTGAFFLIGLGVLVVLFFSPRSPLNKTGSTPPVAGAAQYDVPIAQNITSIDLTGDWYIKENAIVFQAKVTDKHIKITMATADGDAAAYWEGTFENQGAPGSTINSNRDQDAIMLASPQSKYFKVGDNSLSFEFGAMGVTKTVVMQRG